MNITSLAMSLLTPAVVGRIASALGINPTLAQMAISAALPAILAAIAGKATQTAGLETLTGLLGQQDPSLLGQLGSVLGGSDQARVVNAGSGALRDLLGAPGVGALTGAVGKFAGVPEAATSGLLGMLAPVALGTLAQQKTAGGLDASGLAALLASQKDNIAAALPAGFSDLLSGTGLLDGMMPAAATPATGLAAAAATAVTTAAAAAATSTMSASAAGTQAMDAVKSAVGGMTTGAVSSASAMTASATDTAKMAAAKATTTAADAMQSGRMAAGRVEDVAARGGSMLRWLLPLAALAVLGVLAWQFLLNRAPTLTAANPIVFENVDVGAKATQLYEGLKTTVASIKDAPSAAASLSKLQDADTQLGDIRDKASKMPEATRKSLAALFATLEPGLEGLVETAIKAAGPDSTVKPVLEQILRRMKAIAQG